MAKAEWGWREWVTGRQARSEQGEWASLLVGGGRRAQGCHDWVSLQPAWL